MPHPTDLPELHREIDARVAAIRAGHPDWPCARGCDRCCRSLARLPQLTAGEWELLHEGLAALPPPQLEAIRARAAELGDDSPAPLTCPLLDRDSGACPVYAQRPVACRTYGFYAQRGLGLYCGEIEAQVARGQLDDVVWGNHDGIERRLAGGGPVRSLAAWLADDAAEFCHVP